MAFKVFLTTTIPEQGLKLLSEQGYEVETGVLKNAKGAHALLSLLTDLVDEKAMDAIGPQLKVVSNMAVGFDNIDLEAARERNIAITNTPGVLTQSVAEHAAALILGIARRIAEGDRFTRKGKFKGWDPGLLVGMELAGKTFGIVGHGRIGCKTAEIMTKGFGMKGIYSDVQGPREHEQCGVQKRSLQELLSEADVVSLHVPLLAATRHLIGEKELQGMKETAYLVNTARGAVLDEQALVKALQEKRIAGAALDVFEQEPKLAPGLLKLENVLLTPHIASATKEARERMALLAVQNIIDVLSGKTPESVVG